VVTIKTLAVIIVVATLALCTIRRAKTVSRLQLPLQVLLPLQHQRVLLWVLTVGLRVVTINTFAVIIVVATVAIRTMRQAKTVWILLLVLTLGARVVTISTDALLIVVATLTLRTIRRTKPVSRLQLPLQHQRRRILAESVCSASHRRTPRRRPALAARHWHPNLMED